jgi:3-(3-hydroxy-phenyl)propionate hydroxylase
MAEMSAEVVDAVVVGCGPVGGIAANYLALRGLSTLVIERDLSVFTQPRAFSCDDEAQRNFQAAGLEGELAVDLWPCKSMDYIDGSQRLLGTVPFGELDFGLSHPAIAFFNQPQLEMVLRQGLKRFPQARLQLGHELVSYTQDTDFVTVQIMDRRTGRVREVLSRFLLGCDGSHSTVRALMGVKMVGTSYEEPWIAISGTTKDPEPDYTYYVCDPVRPGFVTRCVYNEVRMDFLLQENERTEVIEKEDVVEKLLAPYVDPKKIQLQRASVYTFQAKVAERWRDGRVFLLGDAAHVMPPFAGQGMCSGIRDAMNLAWKLALVARGAASEALLDTYERERHPHAVDMIKTTITMGRVLLARNRVIAALRNALLRLMFRIPRTRRFMRNYEFKPKALVSQGLISGGRRRKEAAEGSYFPQPKVGLAGGKTVRLDDVCGHGFVVFTLASAEESVRQSAEALAREIGGLWLRILPPDRAQEARPGDVVDISGKLAVWLARYHADAAVVRPDHYVYGASRGAAIEQLRTELGRFIHLPTAARSAEGSARALLPSSA